MKSNEACDERQKQLLECVYAFTRLLFGTQNVTVRKYLADKP